MLKISFFEFVKAGILWAEKKVQVDNTESGFPQSIKVSNNFVKKARLRGRSCKVKCHFYKLIDALTLKKFCGKIL